MKKNKIGQLKLNRGLIFLLGCVLLFLALLIAGGAFAAGFSKRHPVMISKVPAPPQPIDSFGRSF